MRKASRSQVGSSAQRAASAQHRLYLPVQQLSAGVSGTVAIGNAPSVANHRFAPRAIASSATSAWLRLLPLASSLGQRRHARAAPRLSALPMHVRSADDQRSALHTDLAVASWASVSVPDGVSDASLAAVLAQSG